ncbi:MAG: ABC transporter permease [Muribaculaceae bacterium]|nr:ABC transporter permease [Muribaculaceae bacterium]
MNNNLGIIVRREFMERVGKKSFIFTTLLMPVLMLLLMAMPALIAIFSTPSDKTVAVNDLSGYVMQVLKNADISHLTFVSVDESADSALSNTDYYGVLSIPADIVEHPSSATLFLHESGSVETESTISELIRQAVRDQRMRAYDIENLNQILEETNVDVNLQTVRIDESGETENTSSAVSFGIGMFMTFLLYMFLLMYGQLVMTSIIEEKNNRVLELVVSSVKPVYLMLGKIFGVGLVAIVQIVIWGVLLCAMSAFLLPALMPAEVTQQVAMFNAGEMATGAEALDPSLLNALSIFSSVGYIAKLFAFILIFLIGGFLFYASIFAAIGSAVDNIQDASQLTSFAVIPIIIGLVVGMTVGNDPNSTLAFWASLIPFTSPMVMLMRVPFGIPSWEIWLSVVVLYASFIAMVWLAAKIYRIGIFMYGKKPSMRDLIRWARYK